MFGGEYCDGEGTTVFNDLFRWNVEKGGGEWYVSTHVLQCVRAVQSAQFVFLSRFSFCVDFFVWFLFIYLLCS